MNPFDPFNVVHLSALGVMRNITIALPSETVAGFLPPGLKLGPQQLTKPGTHPVTMGFHNIIGEHLSIPSLMPRLTYAEHSVGIPYCYVTPGRIDNYTPGPYFFMPKLLVNNAMAAFGGRLFWGFNKHLASIQSDKNEYRVFGEDGRTILRLSYKVSRKPAKATEFKHFRMQQSLVSQPLISLLPYGYGPFFVVAGFPKKWSAATIGPVNAELEIYEEYVPGLLPGRYPEQGKCPTIDDCATGGYVICAPLQVGSPYPPMPSFSSA